MKNKSVFLLQLAGNIRQSRQFKQMSQDSVAKQAKMARRYYGDIEAGRINPSIISLIKIALTLDVSLDALIPVDFSLQELNLDIQ